MPSSAFVTTKYWGNAYEHHPELYCDRCGEVIRNSEAPYCFEEFLMKFTDAHKDAVTRAK